MKRIIFFILLMMPLFAIGQKSFSTGTFQRSQDYKLMNSAKITGGNVQLTGADEWATGAIWFKKKVKVEHGFETEFQILIDKVGGWGGTGADGLAFVISNDPKGLSVGEAGEGIGYQGISNCVVVEFDTFDNEEGGNNHVSIQTNGKGTVSRFNNHSIAINHKIPPLRNKTRTVKVVYDFKYMKVYIDSKLYIKKAISLEQVIQLDKGKAWIGFTASTAGAFSQHRILNWKWLRTDRILAFKPNNEQPTTAQLTINNKAILREEQLVG